MPCLQQVEATSLEQEAAIADLKIAMERGCTRSLRIAKERACIARSIVQEEQNKIALRHEMKFRIVTEELACLCSAQSRLDEARNRVRLGSSTTDQ